MLPDRPHKNFMVIENDEVLGRKYILFHLFPWNEEDHSLSSDVRTSRCFSRMGYNCHLAALNYEPLLTFFQVIFLPYSADFYFYAFLISNYLIGSKSTISFLQLYKLNQ